MFCFYFKTVYIEKISSIFETTKGTRFTILANHGTTVNELLKMFFNRIGKPYLMGCKDIVFIYNAQMIKYEDQTPIENFFSYNPFVRITVNAMGKIILD